MSRHSRRRFLAAVGAGATGSVTGCAGFRSDDAGAGTATTRPQSPVGTAAERETDGTAMGPETTGRRANRTTSGTNATGDVVATASIPADDTKYAVMGSADASATATLFGGWKCPYTQNFVQRWLPEIVREYVRPGDLRVRFRAVRFLADQPHGDDEPRANRAGLAVWHSAPASFWPYFSFLFDHQPPETTEWATKSKLLQFAESAGVESARPIARAITGTKHRDLWQRTMDVVSRRGIEGIPRIALGGEVTAPTLDPDATRRQLRTALE